MVFPLLLVKVYPSDQCTKKADWISDASDLLELPINMIPAIKVDLSRAELKRISERKSGCAL